METGSREELTQRLIESVEHLNRQLRLDRLSEWQDLDLTIPQAKTLFLLEREGPQRMGSIAGALGIAVSATTTVVDRLVDRGLATRLSDPKDRRVVICELTEQGRQAADGFWTIGHERLRGLADHLQVEQLTGLVQAFEQLCDAKVEATPDS
ncbi:MAG: MarR family transcriptional regulator [bacterium]|nr:MarR family transcriptional regulator [bacterium]MXV91803.1 MarR family transcriptional regulator [Acidimicrobiia bacterium]MYC46137.1 MarR family transcriptional regulator [Acidimicrobiia bacterium]MYI19163.1 MarR family transcriptional regulator [Acidimicrobiia bacterium]